MKTLHLSKKRLLIGLVGLLFITGFVNTIGILNLYNKGVSGDSQKAQVATSDCLQVTYKYDRLLTANLNDGTNKKMYSFVNSYNIKNLCSYNVYIVEPEELDIYNGGIMTSQLAYSVLQTLDQSSNPTIVFNGTGNESIQVTQETINCIGTGCLSVSVQAPGFQYGNLSGIKIEPNQTREFKYFAEMKVPYSFHGLKYLAMYPIKLRWFKEGALPGGITGSEALYFNFPNSFFRSSFVLGI